MVKLIELSNDSTTTVDKLSSSGSQFNNFQTDTQTNFETKASTTGPKPVKLLSDDSVNSEDVQGMVKSLGFQYHPSTKAQIFISLIAEGIISEDIDRLREEVFNSKLVTIPTSDNQAVCSEFDYSEPQRGPPALVGSKDT